MRLLATRSMERGFVLYAVLIVVVLSSMVAVSLLYATKSAQTASTAGEQGEQAWAVAMSGVYKAMEVVLSSEVGSTSWQDDPDAFKEQLVLDDGQNKWYFTVYEWNGASGSEEALVYGLSDEASKLNLKYVSNEVKTHALESDFFATLTKSESSVSEGFELLDEDSDSDYLSGIQEDSEAASDSKPSEEGAPAPAAEKSEPTWVAMSGRDNPPEYEFLDAFVTQAGYNLRTLYGKDLDMNLKADSGTEDVGEVFQEGVASGEAGMGLRNYLTTVSYDLNTNAAGEARINLNQSEASLSSLGLSEETLAFVEAMRRKGKTIQNPAVLLNATEKLEDEEGAQKDYTVALTQEEMEVVFDNCTTLDQKYLPALINVNTASEEVLMALPGIEESEAEAIVSGREGLMSDQMKTPAWLIEQGILDTEKFQAIYPYITTRSWQYHFYVVGYSMPSGRYRVLEVVVDTAGETPQILMMRDLSRLGMPFKVDSEGRQATAVAVE